MDKAFVQGRAVAHCGENARAERRCDCDWYGRYGVVSFACETVAKIRIGDAHSRKQEVDWSHGIISSHYMPTQSGGSAQGPSHEHLEHGTELLSKLKRSGDHVILGGDANSHLGPN